MIQGGWLRKPCHLQSNAETVNEDLDPVRAWTDDAILRLSVQPLTGREAVEAQQLNVSLTHKARGRYNKLYRPEKRILVPTTITTLAVATTGTTGTTVGVSSADGFSAGKNYDIQIDDELMRVTAGQGTTSWTVSRGEYGTTAATHTTGTNVFELARFGISEVRNLREQNREVEMLCEEQD